MSIPYEASGRVRQKSRTRAALVAATRALLAQGVGSPTVEAAADHAEISRTTAYRYFRNQHELLLAVFPRLDAESLLDGVTSDDPLERLDVVTERIAQQILEYEPELRAMLRLSLAQDPARPASYPLRRGRVIGWLEDALAPLRGPLPAASVRRLALAVRATLGIESLVWLVDVGGVSRKQAVAIMRESARALVRCALEDTGRRPGLSRARGTRAARVP